MTQKALGKACGLRFQQIYNHECGSTEMPVGRLMLLAKALGVPERFFYEEIGDNAIIPFQGAGSSQGNREHLNLIRLLERLSPSDCEQVKIYATLLIEAYEAVAA